MSKRILCALSLFICSPLYASENYPYPIELKGIKVIPSSKMPMPAILKNEYKMKLSEESDKGYIETGEPVARHLFNIQESAKKELKMNYSAPYDSHLKKSFSDIKLSVPFKEIVIIPKHDVIGYAAAGSYGDQGWNGIVQFFVNKDIGNCSISRYTINGALLSEETTEYFVNKKPSSRTIHGNTKNGFLYKITWFSEVKDHSFLNMLECSNMKFDKKFIDELVDLAIKIDNGN